MNWILIIIIALLFSAFFSGMEIAFVSSNKVRVELDMKQQGMMSKILGLFYGNEEQFISTMLVGNNIALVIYGMGMAALLEPVIALVWNQEAFVVLMQTLLSTLLILFVGEFLPKTIFRVNPNAIFLSFRVVALCRFISDFEVYVCRFQMRDETGGSEDRTSTLWSPDEQDRT